jgi:hypothetical protein
MAEANGSAEPGRPILVTGTYRSGTTWVGRMLALSPGVHYVHEPFAPMYPRSWLRSPPTQQFFHQPPGEAGPYAEDLARIVALRPPFWAIARRVSGTRTEVRLAQEAVQTALARHRRARALIKDPFALLSAEWLQERTDAHVIVLVRHPAGFVSSVKRLGWRFDVGSLLERPTVMSGPLAAFRGEFERERAAGKTDLVDHAALMWRALNTVVLSYATQHRDWCIVRYEDLASDPVPAFERLSARVDVDWDDRLAAAVARSNATARGAETDPRGRGSTERDSRRAMWTWRDRLSADEVARVRESTADVAAHWYGDRDWSSVPAPT